VIPYYVDSAVCLGSAMLGMKAAAEEEHILWGPFPAVPTADNQM